MFNLNPNKISTNIWFNERTNRWNWVLIWECKDGVTHMDSGNAFTKEQAKQDIMNTKVWISENWGVNALDNQDQIQ